MPGKIVAITLTALSLAISLSGCLAAGGEYTGKVWVKVEGPERKGALSDGSAETLHVLWIFVAAIDAEPKEDDWKNFEAQSEKHLHRSHLRLHL